MRGKFITMEGSEGAGKSTNLAVVESILRDRSIPHVTTREPGGTPVAEQIRSVLLGEWAEDLSGLTELLLVFAAREQHLTEVIRPALAEGTWVVCDRFTDATYAYQGFGRELGLEQIAALERWVHGDLQPDLTLYLDVPPETSAARLANRAKDRMEQENTQFFERVRAGYRARAEETDRICTIDASRDLEDVQADVARAIEAFLARAGGVHA